MQSFAEKDKKKSKTNNRFKHRNYNSPRYWQPGQQLTYSDIKLLAEVKNFYQENGYTPAKEDISNTLQLKSRFRTWKNVLAAAGLPDRNDPDNQRKRMAAIDCRKQSADKTDL